MCIILQVSFLASSVGPRVAASCAHAALTVFSEDNGVSASASIMEGSGQRCFSFVVMFTADSFYVFHTKIVPWGAHRTFSG